MEFFSYRRILTELLLVYLRHNARLARFLSLQHTQGRPYQRHGVEMKDVQIPQTALDNIGDVPLRVGRGRIRSVRIVPDRSIVGVLGQLMAWSNSSQG